MKFKQDKKKMLAIVSFVIAIIFLGTSGMFTIVGLGSGEFIWNNYTFEYNAVASQFGSSNAVSINPTVSAKVSSTAGCNRDYGCYSASSSFYTSSDINLCEYDEVKLDFTGSASSSGEDCGGGASSSVTVTGFSASSTGCTASNKRITNPEYKLLDDGKLFAKDLEGDSIVMTCPQYLSLGVSTGTPTNHVSTSAEMILNKFELIKYENIPDPLNGGINTVYVNNTIVKTEFVYVNNTQLVNQFVCLNGDVVSDISKCDIDAPKPVNYSAIGASSIFALIGLVLLFI
jgi:hypothetical protein